ncbi:DUF2314 domain-containing protein [Rubritalea squalenifaciens]|nr:DUF2314 domain-containing protein [Rubritalea squalenifaciens]
MKHAILTLIVVAVVLPEFSYAQEKLEKHPDREDVTGVDGEDKEMLAAQEKARKSLMTFVQSLQKRDKSKRYLLKVILEEDGETEHVWLEPVKWNDPGLLGILSVDPVAIKKHKKGDVIAPLPSDISDWVILSSDGSKQGGFTVDVIEKRRTKTKQGEQGAAPKP